MPIRSVRHIDFVKDDVSCLDMPAGHSWSDSGTPAPSLLRRRGRSENVLRALPRNFTFRNAVSRQIRDLEDD